LYTVLYYIVLYIVPPDSIHGLYNSFAILATLKIFDWHWHWH